MLSLVLELPFQSACQPTCPRFKFNNYKMTRRYIRLEALRGGRCTCNSFHHTVSGVLLLVCYWTFLPSEHTGRNVHEPAEPTQNRLLLVTAKAQSILHTKMPLHTPTYGELLTMVLSPSATPKFVLVVPHTEFL